VSRDAIVYGPSVIYMVAEMIRQWSDEGDGVVVHTPAYDAFYNTIAGNQRRVAPVPLSYRDNQWHCDMAQLERTLAEPRNTLLLLCSPHNPTGKVWRREELETMAMLCEKHGVKVISDEIHMDMVWGAHRHTPWCDVARGPWALFTSGSKSFNIPAFTGAYGLIDDVASREAYLTALKGAMDSHRPRYRRWSPILPPTVKAPRGSTRFGPICRTTCAILLRRSIRPSRS
jgi:cystathionine beta-lyase